MNGNKLGLGGGIQMTLVLIKDAESNIYMI